MFLEWPSTLKPDILWKQCSLQCFSEFSGFWQDWHQGLGDLKNQNSLNIWKPSVGEYQSSFLNFVVVVAITCNSSFLTYYLLHSTTLGSEIMVLLQLIPVTPSLYLILYRPPDTLCTVGVTLTVAVNSALHWSMLRPGFRSLCLLTERDWLITWYSRSEVSISLNMV